MQFDLLVVLVLLLLVQKGEAPPRHGERFIGRSVVTLREHLVDVGQFILLQENVW